MRTLVIYDNNGTIFTQLSGDYVRPVGLQYIETTIPQSKILVGVNVDTHEPIFEDIPKSEVEILREELQAAQQAIDFLIMGGM